MNNIAVPKMITVAKKHSPKTKFTIAAKASSTKSLSTVDAGSLVLSQLSNNITIGMNTKNKKETLANLKSLGATDEFLHIAAIL